MISMTWEYNTFILGGDVILIENDLLADALNALPQDNRDILLMYWFCLLYTSLISSLC